MTSQAGKVNVPDLNKLEKTIQSWTSDIKGVISTSEKKVNVQEATQIAPALNPAQFTQLLDNIVKSK